MDLKVKLEKFCEKLNSKSEDYVFAVTNDWTISTQQINHYSDFEYDFIFKEVNGDYLVEAWAYDMDGEIEPRRVIYASLHDAVDELFGIIL